MYAIVEGGSVVEYPISDLRVKFPQISFPDKIPEDSLPDGVVPVVFGPKPAHNPDTEMLSQGMPQFVDGVWRADYSVVPLPLHELQFRLQTLAGAVRNQRNIYLQQSDWTQLADAQVDRAAWAAYRQALRDVPSQDGFPRNVNWPTKPE